MTQFFDKEDFVPSRYPNYYIPKGGIPITGVDTGTEDGDRACTVKGFMEGGVLHIQEVVYLPNDS